MYTNQLIRETLTEALNSNLSKAKWDTLAALLIKTLGYNKVSDNLAMSQIVKLTGKNKNHQQTYLNDLAKSGIITISDAKIGQCYTLTKFAHLSKTRTQSIQLSDKAVRDSDTYIDKLQQTKTTTYPAEADQAIPQDKPQQPAKQKGSSELVYPIVINPSIKHTVAKTIKQLTCSQQQQQTLDVLAAMIDQGKVKTNPISLLHSLVKAAHNGTLDTSLIKQRTTLPCFSKAKQDDIEAKLEAHAQAQFKKQMAAFGMKIAS